MFNVRRDAYVPEFRVRPTEDLPGFRVNANDESREAPLDAAYAIFADYARAAKSAPLDFLSATPGIRRLR
ncbi:hypothetical protein SAMN02990966_04757 [Rhodospirillales bacterium URHD0017]|nr:hypothetical protein SAMN02990966_04757 [Rhodospirillales bacterium URHD0017]